METTPQEFIAAEDYSPATADSPDSATLTRPPWEETMATLANANTTRITVPRNKSLNRQHVVGAFQDAFELIGGATRLAIWADTHPSEFYRLYAKLLPSQANNTNEQTGEVKVLHVLPPGPLDK